MTMVKLITFAQLNLLEQSFTKLLFFTFISVYQFKVAIATLI